MPAWLRKFQTGLSTAVLLIFMLSIVSTTLPASAQAQQTGSDSPITLSEIQREAETIEHTTRWLLDRVDEIKRKKHLLQTVRDKKDPLYLSDQNVQSCKRCEEQFTVDYQAQNRLAKTFGSLKHVLSSNQHNPLAQLRSTLAPPLKHSETETLHYYEHLAHTDIWRFKQGVETFLNADQDDATAPLAAIVMYAAAVQLFLTLQMLIDPEKNILSPYADDLNLNYALMIPSENAKRIQQQIIHLPQQSKNFQAVLTQLIRFERVEDLSFLLRNQKAQNTGFHAMLFTDTYKLELALSSHLRGITHGDWLKFLKLTTIQYLAQQLVEIGIHFPGSTKQNELFFEWLSTHFPAFKYKTSDLLAQIKARVSSQYNDLLSIDLIKNNAVPTIITAERYRDLSRYADRVEQSLSEAIEDEKAITDGRLFGLLQNYPYHLWHQSAYQRAVWLKKEILKIKRNYFKDYLLREYVSLRKLRYEDALALTDQYLAKYATDLTIEEIKKWFPKDMTVMEALQASDRFQQLSKDHLPAVAQAIGDIEQKMDHAHNKEMRKKIEAFPEIIAHVPNIPSFDNQELSIAFTEENFKILIAMLMEPLGNDIWLLRHGLEKFFEVKTKWELIHQFNTLVNDIETHVMMPRDLYGGMGYYGWFKPRRWFGYSPSEAERPQYEQNQLEEALSKLRGLETRVQKIDPANTETLNDCFTAPQQKLDFFKFKRDVLLLDNFRLLTIPIITGTGNPNHPREEKILLRHYQQLQNQEGLLTEEVEGFLEEQKRELYGFNHKAAKNHSFPVPWMEGYFSHYDREQFQAKRKEAIAIAFEGFSEERTHQALRTNSKIIRRLRKFEKEIVVDNSANLPDWLPREAYSQPERFVKWWRYLRKTKNLLNEIIYLKKEREKEYLDLGGRKLDAWLKDYVSEFMIRQALIHQDLIIRRNIYKITRAKTLEEIKEFVLDPFILKKALSTVQADYFPLEEDAWRLEAFQKIHEQIARQVGHDGWSNYFENPHRRFGMTALAFLSVVLYMFPMPGPQIAAIALGGLLWAEIAVQTTYEMQHNYGALPLSFENRKDFYRSAVSASMEKGPGSFQHIAAMDEALYWQRLITNLTTAALVPGVGLEIHFGLKTFHDAVNLFRTIKIPLYLQKLGLEASDDLSLALIRSRVAQRLGIEMDELAALSQAFGQSMRAGRAKERELIELIAERSPEAYGDALKAGKIKNFLNIYRFFENPEIFQAIRTAQVASCQQALFALRFSENNWPTLKEAKAAAEAIKFNLFRRMTSPSASPLADYGQMITRQIERVDAALKTLEANAQLLLELGYRFNLEAALKTLGLNTKALPTADAFGKMLIPRQNREMLAAWRALKSVYEKTADEAAWVRIQIKLAGEGKIQLKPHVLTPLKQWLSIYDHIPH